MVDPVSMRSDILSVVFSVRCSSGNRFFLVRRTSTSWTKSGCFAALRHPRIGPNTTCYRVVTVSNRSDSIPGGFERHMNRWSHLSLLLLPVLTVIYRIGPETVDLLDQLLVCNPRQRLTAAQALDHDYFWTDPLPADPKS